MNTLDKGRTKNRDFCQAVTREYQGTNDEKYCDYSAAGVEMDDMQKKYGNQK